MVLNDLLRAGFSANDLEELEWAMTVEVLEPLR